jgi:3-oxoacyl-[acyl-carrier protein] reductase
MRSDVDPDEDAFYAATKAEVVILTRRFAMELGPHDITVNAVAPGSSAPT